MLKFIFVLACFAIAVISYFFCHSKRDWFWLTCGLFFTVLADYFLVLQNSHLPGVAVFCFVHVCYILRVQRDNIWLGLLIIVPVIVGFLFYNGWLYALAGFYAMLFITNITVNIKWRKQNKALVVTGLILFALCDINVAVYNFAPQFSLVFALIWVFYLPSQFLLAISGIKA